MTPKEKAKELVDKFNDLEICVEHIVSDGRVCSHLAKQCALITVDEIISSFRNYFGRLDEDLEMHMNYWQQVKTEIEAL